MNLEIPSKYKGTLKAAYGAAEKILRPISRKYDLAEHTYPKELDMLAAALEAMNTPAAESAESSSQVNETNTKNGSNMQSVLYIQALNYGDVGMSLTIPGRGLGNAAISAVANPEQLQRFGKTWAAMAITEPGAGSDSAAITTTAKKDGDFYILNGEKIFITAGERAGAVVVWATLDKGLGRAAIKSFVVEKGTPGMELIRVEKKLGIRASDTAAIMFTNCRVPAANLLGNAEIDVKKGFAGVMETFDNTRPFVAAMSLGAAQAAIERTRELIGAQLKLNDFTNPINNVDAVEAEFFRMEADYEAARLLVLRAAWMADNRMPNSMEASICKAKAGRVCTLITLKCIELLSSIGYSQQELLEKWGRDSKILDIFEGTQQIQQLIIARRLLGKTSQELK
jgi:acyl-CoA dehydrogenase